MTGPSAAVDGGGTINRSLFAFNSVQKTAAPIDGSGGALAFAQRTTLSITNTTFYGNRAEGTSFNANGGAITGSNGVVRNTAFRLHPFLRLTSPPSYASMPA